MSMKNSSDIVGNRTRDLLTCSLRNIKRTNRVSVAVLHVKVNAMAEISPLHELFVYVALGKHFDSTSESTVAAVTDCNVQILNFFT